MRPDLGHGRLPFCPSQVAWSHDADQDRTLATDVRRISWLWNDGRGLRFLLSGVTERRMVGAPRYPLVTKATTTQAA
jgi:hypothetical protein